jgi:hypothetical protein
MRGAYADLQVQRRLAYDLPWSHAVLRALELDTYRDLKTHVPGFVAAQVGISIEEEQRYLSALLEAGQIRRSKGRFVVARVLTVDTRLDEARNRALKAHWAVVGLERLASASHGPDALLSYNLFAVSAKDFERIRRLHIEHFERIRKIVSEADSSDRVVLMNLQLLPLGA